LGNLTLAEGKTLTPTGAPASFHDVVAGNGALIDGSIHVRGALAAEVAAAELAVTGFVEMDPGSSFAATVGSAASDKLVLPGDGGAIFLGSEVSLQFQPDGSDPFAADTYTLIEVDPASEDRISGKFGSVSGLNAYVSADAGSGRDENGLIYDPNDLFLTVTIDYDLLPGDANLDTKTNVLDFNEWNANKFTSPTAWSEGDFNGDGKTNVLDFNIWNENKFTSVAAPGPPAEGQVPEPGTWLLLALAGLSALCARYGRKSR
jgi:hypothetical protein